MQNGGEPLNVKLNCDLTRYNAKLTIGSKGKTMPDHCFLDCNEHDDFVAVRFDSGVEIDILWRSLDVEREKP